MTSRRLVALFGVMALPSCHPRVARPAPIHCPPDTAPTSVREGRIRIKLDGPPPTSLVSGPYTLVLDGKIVGIGGTDADTAALSVASRNIDPATIKAIEILRAPESTQRYPGAVGDVLQITRCY